MRRISLFVILFSFLCIPVSSFVASAGELTVDENKPPSVNEVVKALKPDQQPAMKLRGINYKPQVPEPKIVSVTLQFEKNSYELSEGTKKNLALIGNALNSPDLKTLKFTIEGHADATGSAQYNMDLSKKRAEAVKQYLVQVHKVNPALLKVVGKGEQDLLDPSDPGSMKNRRVRIITNQ